MRGRPRTIPIEDLNWNPAWVGGLEVAALQVLKQFPMTLLEKDDLVSIGWMNAMVYRPKNSKFIWLYTKRAMCAACMHKNNTRSKYYEECCNTDRTEDDWNNMYEPAYETNLDHIDICDFLQDFSERERYIIISKAAGYTFEQIGKELGLTKERIRQIYKELTE